MNIPDEWIRIKKNLFHSSLVNTQDPTQKTSVYINSSKVFTINRIFLWYVKFYRISVLSVSMVLCLCKRCIMLNTNMLCYSLFASSLFYSYIFFFVYSFPLNWIWRAKKLLSLIPHTLTRHFPSFLVFGEHIDSSPYAIKTVKRAVLIAKQQHDVSATENQFFFLNFIIVRTANFFSLHFWNMKNLIFNNFFSKDIC